MSAPSAAELEPGAREALKTVLALLAEERASVSSVTEPERAWRVHVDDSLSGLEVEPLGDLPRESPISALELGFRGSSSPSPCPPPRSS